MEKNKKKLTLIIFVLLFFITGTIIYINYFYLKENNNLDKINIKNEEIVVKKTKTIPEKIDKDKVETKIEKLRKRLQLRGLIVKGDIFLRNEQLTLALKKYLEVYKQNPKDEKIIKKLGDTYMKMKKFKKAYNYYKTIKDYKSLDKNEAILSLIYSKDLNDIVNIKYIQKELELFSLNEEDLFYYKNSLKCLEDFHLCKKDFNTFFIKNKNLKNKNLISIKNAVKNYRNFKTEGLYYKDALIIGSYYINKIYPISIILGEKLLKEKTEYRPILKIVAKSYFELGKYEFSKKVLSAYYLIDKEDPGIIFLLGIVNSKLHEYVLSNIYLNKAIEKLYKPAIDVKRKLVHNYFILGNIERLLSSFKMLVTDEDADKEDLQLAIYYHIINDDLDFPIKWAKKGIEIYPKDDMFYGYLGWIYKEKGESNDAIDILKKGLEINPKNPLILLNIGYSYKLKGNKNKSVVYFKKTIKLDKDGEFGSLAQKEIDLIKKEKEIIKNSIK